MSANRATNADRDSLMAFSTSAVGASFACKGDRENAGGRRLGRDTGLMEGGAIVSAGGRRERRWDGGFELPRGGGGVRAILGALG